MAISREEAAVALSQIERTAVRSDELQGYRIVGPILMLWGVIWVIGYVAMGLLSQEKWGTVWLVLDLLGIVLTILMSRRKLSDPIGTAAWRTLGGFVAVGAFCCGVFAIFHANSPNTYLAFPGLLTGTLYCLVGAWRMLRLLWIGAAVLTATLIGFFLVPPPLLPFWMAVAGGGGLIVSGLWLRRA